MCSRKEDFTSFCRHVLLGFSVISSQKQKLGTEPTEVQQRMTKASGDGGRGANCEVSVAKYITGSAGATTGRQAWRPLRPLKTFSSSSYCFHYSFFVLTYITLFSRHLSMKLT
jgi:hypothetical protein